MKKIFPGAVLSFLFFVVLTFFFGVRAANAGYLVMVRHFVQGTDNMLLPDFSYNVMTIDVLMSILYAILLLAACFWFGKRGYRGAYIGIITYSAIPYIGLLGIPFIEINKLGFLTSVCTMAWTSPYLPLLISESSVSRLVGTIGVAMVAVPLLCTALYFAGKKLQY